VSIHDRQLRDLIRRTLADVDLWSSAAENLLLGTCAQESRLGTYIRQLGGPALGIMQIEPATFQWLQGKYCKRFPEIATAAAPQLEWDLRLSIIMARLRYLVVPSPLPAAGDMHGLAAYWKKYYNTEAGSGTLKEFAENYLRYVTQAIPRAHKNQT